MLTPDVTYPTYTSEATPPPHYFTHRGTCPHCDSPETYPDDTDSDGEVMWENWLCLACRGEWFTTFAFVHRTVIGDGFVHVQRKVELDD